MGGMPDDLTALIDFIQSNRQPLAKYIRQNIIKAGAKSYLDNLGKDGIEALDRGAAGVLLDLACALLRRLNPDRPMTSEEALTALPESVRNSIRLARSEAYYAVLPEIKRIKGGSNPPSAH
jgi:hypothetical protein